jgi:pyruvate/2-oxoglutarate dehydrogenase complex dihydrolipoamide acyltransferase (E2) component
MIYRVVVPYIDRMGDEGVLALWHSAEGEEVRHGDDLFELTVTPRLVMTNPYAVTVTSNDAGILRKVLVRAGTFVRVGDVVALVSTDGSESLDTDSPADSAFRVVCNRG